MSQLIEREKEEELEEYSLTNYLNFLILEIIKN